MLDNINLNRHIMNLIQICNKINMHTSLFALLCAVATGMVIANAWYSPFLFGKIEKKERRKYLKDQEASDDRLRRKYGWFYLHLFLIAFVLGELFFIALHFYGGNKVIVGAGTGFFVWLGIAAPILFLHYLGFGISFRLYLLDIGYQLVSLTAIGAVLGLLSIATI